MVRNLKLLVFGILITGCAKEKAAPTFEEPVLICDNEVSFTADVQPIIEFHCANNECHNSFMYGSDILLNDYNEISSAAADENFLKAIKHNPGVSPMPMGRTQLSASEIQKIECWINQGRKNN